MINSGGHGLNQHDKHRAQPVSDFEAGAGAARHDDAQRKPQRQRKCQRNQPQLQGNRDFFGDDLRDGNTLAVDVGFTQIAVKKLLIEIQKLLGKRVGQTQRGQLYLHLGRVHFVVVLEIALNGHQPQQGKQNGDDDEHGNQRAQNALGDVFCHN